MNQDFPEDEILVEFRGGLAVVAINRPAMLNALSLDMIREISSLLREWETFDRVKAVLFTAVNGRAFCAGGDMKAIYAAGMDYRRGAASPRVPLVFFAEEYLLNRQIFHYSKPVISFMDGITMGGGYGIGGNCRHRVATERTVFAMPETGIGFFPDVGSLYHLCRAKRHFGRYLALTGESVGGADMVAAGLAEHFISSQSLAAAQDALGDAVEKSGDIAAILAQFVGNSVAGDGDFISHGAEIEAQFADPDARAVVRAGTGEFSRKVSQTILSRSPISVMVTSLYLKMAESMTFDEIISMDFNLAQGFVKAGDLYEGIRAVLIDKDKTPRWSLQSLDVVTDAAVNAYFTPTGYDLGEVQIFEK